MTCVYTCACAVITACEACQEFAMSYYDAQIWTAAQRNGVGTVLSEDMADGEKYGDIRIINPIRPEFAVTSLIS